MNGNSIVSNNENKSIDELLEQYNTYMLHELQKIVEFASQPYQTAILEMSQEIRSLIQVMKNQDDDMLMYENIKLKTQLKAKTYEIMALEKMLKPKRSIWTRLIKGFRFM